MIAAIWVNQPAQVVVVKERVEVKETSVPPDDQDFAQVESPPVQDNFPRPEATQPVAPPPAYVFRPLPETLAENGWPLYTKPAEGFALALPPEWREIEMTPTLFNAGMQEILKFNPQLKGLGDPQQSNSAQIKFYGVDESALHNQSSALVNVSCVQVPEWTTLEDVRQEIAGVWGKVVGVKLLENSIVARDSGNYVRIRFTMPLTDKSGRAQMLAMTQLYHLNGNKLYITNLAAAVGNIPRYTKSFEAIEKSFETITPLDVD